MHDSKALGPDGFPASFFQKYWAEVGDSSTTLVKRIFCTGTVPRDLNRALIYLIPKVHNLESFSQLRPISLCNVIMKLVTKIIANRL